MRRLARIFLWTAGALVGLVLIAIAAGLVIVRTDWFRDKVHDRIVSEAENATGGRVELGSFVFDWKTLTAEVRDFVLHGKEGPGEAPLFRADRVTVTLRVISILKQKVDLYSVAVNRPQVNVIVYPDGGTNFPQPKRARERKKGTVQTILDLAIKRFNLSDGTVQFALRRMPLNVFGENLQAQIFYDTSPGAIPAPRYRADLSFRQLGVKPGERQALPFDVTAKAALANDAVEITSLHLGLRRSSIDVSGRIRDFTAPRAELQYAARVYMEDIAPAVGVQIFPAAGTVNVGGFMTVSGRDAYRLEGELKGSGLVVEPRRGMRFSNIAVESGVVLTPDGLDFPRLTVRGMGGRMDGRFSLAHFRDLRLDGEARGFSIHELTHFPGVPHADWNGLVSGPVQLTGAIRDGRLASLSFAARLGIRPAPGPNPMGGLVDLRWNRGREIEFGDSYLTTRASRIGFSGALGRQLAVTVDSTDLRDLEPGIALVRGKPYEIPVKLAPNGTAKFGGTVTGPLSNPSIQGRVAATNFSYEQYTADSATATVQASRTGVQTQDIDARKGGIHATGWVRVGLKDWKATDEQPLTGVFNVQSPEVEPVLAELNQSLPVKGGPMSAEVTLSGTIAAPAVGINALASRLLAWGEPVPAVKAQVRISQGLVQVAPAIIQAAGTRVQFSGSYTYPRNDARHGRLRFDVTTRGVQLAMLRAVQERSAGIEGALETQLSGDVVFEPSGFRINTVNGWAALRGLTFEKQELGSMLFAADTVRGTTVITADGEIAGAHVAGRSEWMLAGDYPVTGHLEFTSLDFSTVIERLRNMPAVRGLPFDGYASGRIEFAGATQKPETIKGTAQITQLEIHPDPAVVPAATAQQLVLRNAAPIVVDFDTKSARIREAVLRGRDTDINIAGRVSFNAKNPFDLRARGQVNLALLRDFEPRLYAAGIMELDVSVRGRPSQPDIYGRVDLKKASLNWPGIPNGIDNASGVIFLYRDRASIDRITAQTGGGKVVMTGFVGFSPAVTFHLQARADGVRVRYPEGVSSTADATLALSGTLDRSVLSGEVTITRIGFNPRSDLGSILASTAQPVETPEQPNRFLQGMRLIVHIQTSPQVRLETKLTRDVQADADLRLRGNATRPALLGRVMISQGEVLFFGNQYEIQSGQILFVNPSKIEPVVNLDLETRARGVEITLHVSGPVNKLNLTFRSDPPLQSSDVVALLATGRTPTGAGTIAGAQTPTQWQQAGASAILSQALANPIAGRLQRFFGVSRLKIDPQVTGLTTNNAAARVTLEQQITRNLAFTYITDLTRPQAQTIRVELDLTRNWSAVAQREENGLFGIDFLYKKQLK